MKKLLTISLLASTLLTSCNLAPELVKPEVSTPEEFKWVNADDKSPINDGNWKLVELSEKSERGEWWKIFADEKLNELEQKAFENNLELEIAVSRVEQARSLAERTRGSLFPSLNIGASPTRYQQSNAFTGLAPTADPVERTIYRADATLAYELDLFGRLRNDLASANFNADSAENSMKSVLLSLQADVATNYFALKTIDRERDIVSRSIKLGVEAERIIKKKFEIGDVSKQDYMRAVAALAGYRAQLIGLERSRAELENALAVLVGENPSEFKISELSFNEMPPKIPSGLPSNLLERRPDINSAADKVAAANAKIGVARAAFFPTISLSANGGFESNEIEDLFKWSSRTWTLGPLFGTMVSLPIFEGGKGVANLDLSKAGYKESVANYRLTVLNAFKDVENSLVGIRKLSEQSEQQKLAADSTEEVARLSRLRFKEGYADFLEVVDAERDSLAQQQNLNSVQGARFTATISLIRALGGGFDVPILPGVDDDILKPVVTIKGQN